MNALEKTSDSVVQVPYCRQTGSATNLDWPSWQVSELLGFLHFINWCTWKATNFQCESNKISRKPHLLLSQNALKITHKSIWGMDNYWDANKLFFLSNHREN